VPWIERSIVGRPSLAATVTAALAGSVADTTETRAMSYLDDHRGHHQRDRVRADQRDDVVHRGQLGRQVGPCDDVSLTEMHQCVLLPVYEMAAGRAHCSTLRRRLVQPERPSAYRPRGARLARRSQAGEDRLAIVSAGRHGSRTAIP
jgi:hypothetical protein